MQRTTIFLAPVQIDGLAQAAEEDGLCSAQIVRIAINDWLGRRKRAAQRAGQRGALVKAARQK